MFSVSKISERDVMGEETTAYIGLGSNLGNGRLLLRQAWEELGRIDGIRLDGLSSPWLSAPVGMVSPHWFTNAVGRLRTGLGPLELLQALLAVEKRFGRERGDRNFGYQDRSLDLDLLYYGELVMDSPELTLPHPRISERLFVLLPLAELDVAFSDPRGWTAEQAAKRLQRRIAAGELAPQEIVAAGWEETGE